MSNENKNALENAGGKNNTSEWLTFFNKGAAFEVININAETLYINIYTKESDNCAIHNIGAKDLKDVQAICYGYLGYYLDFTEKPKYDWKTVKAGLSVANRKLWEDTILNLHNLCQIPSLMDGKEYSSIIAQLKLNLIIQQIDKDYPNTDGKTGTITLIDETELRVDWTDRPNNKRFCTASQDGAKKLLETNPKLLQELFKIKQDAND